MVVKIRSSQQGSHVFSTIFVGEDIDHLASAGEIRLRLTEFQLFIGALKIGAEETKMTLLHEYFAGGNDANVGQST